MSFTEQEMERGDYLRDEQQDRMMEERDEAAAAHLRSIPASPPPRFFRDPGAGDEWEFRNGKMTVNYGDESIFRSPSELLECLDVIEVDEFGNPLEPSAEDIAAERGDREQQQEADES